MSSSNEVLKDLIVKTIIKITQSGNIHFSLTLNGDDENCLQFGCSILLISMFNSDIDPTIFLINSIVEEIKTSGWNDKYKLELISRILKTKITVNKESDFVRVDWLKE